MGQGWRTAQKRERVIMLLNSVNTNVSAATALRQLGRTETDLAATRRRVSTGLRVASARDSGSNWSIAQSQRGDIRAINAILSSLQRGQSALDVSIAAGTRVSDLLIRMKEKALAASDSGLSPDALAAMNQDFVLLRDELARTVESAGFNGLNLVNADAEDREILAGLGMETKYIPGKTQIKTRRGVTTVTVKPGVYVTGRSTVTLPGESLALGGPNVTVSDIATVTDPAKLAELRTQIDASIRNVSNALARLGGAANTFERQQGFLRKLQDSLSAGVGSLVDADMVKESARLRALQTKQQLGIQALSIANRAPQVLTQLFRT